MTTAMDFDAFRRSASQGHLEIILLIYSFSSDELRKAMIESQDYYAFSWAANNHHLGAVRQLCEWCSEEERNKMLAWGDYFAFKRVYDNYAMAKELYGWANEEGKARMKSI